MMNIATTAGYHLSQEPTRKPALTAKRKFLPKQTSAVNVVMEDNRKTFSGKDAAQF